MNPTPASLFSLSGKVAVVTGASRGIGREIALAYARAGADVVLASRKQEGVDRVAAEIAHESPRGAAAAFALACHTGRGEEVDALVARAVDRFGGLDVVVNNAATNPHFGPILEAEDSHWDKTYEVNVKGYARMIRAAAPHLRRRGGGAVVNVASIAGLSPWEGLGVYSVTKAAVLMLTRALAIELAPAGIRVNALAPGFIKTRFSEALWGSPESADRLAAEIPQRRIGEPGDLIGAALYLASDAAAFTTGSVLVVDGGQLAR